MQNKQSVKLSLGTISQVSPKGDFTGFLHMEWFIQLHKKICDWEWYTDITTCKLFFHILLKCNYKEAKWRWKTIKPWEFITSLEHLSLETWLTKQQIRTSIQKLTKTWEITHKSTNEYTMLGLNNWEVYNTWTTNEQQTNNKRITTTNKEYKEKKENNFISKDIKEQALEIVPIEKDFRDKDINNILSVIKTQVQELWFIYKKWKYERERAKNILTWKDFWEVCEKANMPRVEFCRNIIYMSTLLTFWNWKINNAETLYEHYAKVYNDAKNKKKEIEEKRPRWLVV